MCGIIAVVRRFSERAPADAAWVESALVEALRALETGAVGDVAGAFDAAAGQVETVDAALRGTAGVRCLLGAPELAATVDDVVGRIEQHAADVERRVDEDASLLGGQDPEHFNAALIRLKDAAWAVRHDRLRTARAVGALAGRDPGRAAIEAFTSVQIALSALDRLEVRGRDSAGLHLLVDGHGLDLDAPDVRDALSARSRDPLFPSNAVRAADGCLSFVYKAAAEIGELGDNTRVLREAIIADDLLHRALSGDTAQCTVLGHTRWASVGIISQANAHPLNQEEAAGPDRPYVVAALNGDVDNYAELRESAGLVIPPEITTDAKVIPTLVARGIDNGQQPAEAFRAAVAKFEGSTAIGASTAAQPGEILLALRGSGQALYVGLAEDAYIVASEPYGLVEETSQYLRMDGEREAPNGVRGEVVAIDRADAGSLEGIRRIAYDGTALPVSADELTVASITTRDIDRGDYPHFLLKELTEAPHSFRKTLRGKIEEEHGRLRARLADEALPADIGSRLATADLCQVLVIGQGTAAVAGKAVAGFLADALD
ncbi:MAG: glucosamine-6-phosphate synthase, partial [Actinobacteria bacterium]|nr:glucosamine-6-phosphate synthase [Actinomycetota bacterium]